MSTQRTSQIGDLVVVTGASTGIGAATARGLAARGYHVLAGVRRQEDADQLRADGIEPLLLDITVADDVAAIARRVAEDPRSRPLRALVNNAGIAVNAPVETLPMAEWRRQFEVNFFGHVAMTQALLPALLQSSGTVVNISSVGGRVALPTYGAYAGSKFALEAVSDALRREVGHLGVGGRRRPAGRGQHRDSRPRHRHRRAPRRRPDRRAARPLRPARRGDHVPGQELRHRWRPGLQRGAGHHRRDHRPQAAHALHGRPRRRGAGPSRAGPARPSAGPAGAAHAGPVLRLNRVPQKLCSGPGEGAATDLVGIRRRRTPQLACHVAEPLDEPRPLALAQPGHVLPTPAPGRRTPRPRRSRWSGW